MALLVASEEMAALQGVGVLMSIADGELCSTEERGTVVRLPLRRAGGGAVETVSALELRHGRQALHDRRRDGARRSTASR